ncbi:MAG TPA: tRNA (guanosine(46)-N7)-methyltransferase TrmB [Phaeodactylibacter sp.]|nr:tRNA (guanosine(46)-N7)-methyltransferase TrmB [Phaeodactylibacter sp.]
MSRKNKIKRFADLLSYPNVYENFDPGTDKLVLGLGKEQAMKGRWHQDCFHNEHPITLELACGKGEYTVGLGRRYPERNFIGVDIKGARIWKGATQALEEDLSNVAFLRTRIELLHHYFEAGEVAEIWIVFPDPFLKKENRRLTAPSFLELYKKILRPEAIIQLKTDDPTLYEFTLETWSAHEDYELLYHCEDIYADKLIAEDLEIKTFYEEKHLRNGKRIKYLRCRWLGT